MKKIIIPLCVFISLNLMAQDKSVTERKGDRYSFTYRYDKAISAYTATKNLSVDGQRALAESYRKLDENQLAEECYSRLLSAGVGIIPEDYFQYSMVLKENGNYELSTWWMDKFVEISPTDLRAIDYLANKDKLAYL